MWFFKEFYNYLKVRKRYWMIPMYLLLFLFAILLMLGQGVPALTPFIYTIF